MSLSSVLRAIRKNTLCQLASQHALVLENKAEEDCKEEDGVGRLLISCLTLAMTIWVHLWVRYLSSNCGWVPTKKSFVKLWVCPH